jgi:hypothetical protein
MLDIVLIRRRRYITGVGPTAVSLLTSVRVSRIASCLGRNIFDTVSNTVLDIIHRRAFYLKHDVSDTGFCLRLQVELLSDTQYKEFGLEMKAGSFYWAQLSRFHLKADKESSVRNVVC